MRVGAATFHTQSPRQPPPLRRRLQIARNQDPRPGSPRHMLCLCFVSCVIISRCYLALPSRRHNRRASTMPLPTSLPQEHACASHRTVITAVAKSWQKLDLSVPRRLGNPVAGRGHHVAPGGREFGRSSEAAKCPLTDFNKSP